MEEVNLLQYFIWVNLSRANAALPPKRRILTADKWVETINHICKYLMDFPAEKTDQLQRWAAKAALAKHVYTPPPKYTQINTGGVEKSCLQTLAACCMRRTKQPVPDQDLWELWSVAYEASARLGEYAEPMSAEDIDLVLDEWELIYELKGVYQMILEVPFEDYEKFGPNIEKFLGVDFPEELDETVSTNNEFWETIEVYSDAEDERFVITLDSETTNNKQHAFELLMRCPDDWFVQVNDEEELASSAHQFEGTIGEYRKYYDLLTESGTDTAA